MERSTGGVCGHGRNPSHLGGGNVPHFPDHFVYQIDGGWRAQVLLGDRSIEGKRTSNAPIKWCGVPKIIHRGVQGETRRDDKNYKTIQSRTTNKTSYNYESVNVQLYNVLRAPERQTQSCSPQVHASIKLMLEPYPKSTERQ